jgi:hypothetical protein
MIRDVVALLLFASYIYTTDSVLAIKVMVLSISPPFCE